jgi:hypothetical protein
MKKKTTLSLSALFIIVTASLGKTAQAVLIDADRLTNLKTTTPDDCHKCDFTPGNVDSYPQTTCTCKSDQRGCCGVELA